MIKTTQLKGNKLVDRLKQLSKPMNEVVSTNDEIDLDEILREMGYGEDDEMDITQLSKSEIKELIKVEVKKYFEETFENPEDLEINEIMRWKKNTTKQNPTPQSNKWVQNGGTSIDDITFTNGEVEVNFDVWIEKYYNK